MQTTYQGQCNAVEKAKAAHLFNDNDEDDSDASCDSDNNSVTVTTFVGGGKRMKITE
jgi:hypothetical protein